MKSILDLPDDQLRAALAAAFPPELLRLALAGGPARRRRLLPAEDLLALLIASFFRPLDSLRLVARWLLAPWRPIPSESAFCQARGRLASGPLDRLRRLALRPLADPALDGESFYHGRRLLAIDGTTFTTADSPANRDRFGKSGNQHGPSGYPLVRVAALCEVGTHALLDWHAGAYRDSEAALAARVLAAVPPGSLLLADRGFYSHRLLKDAGEAGYDVLTRVQSGPRLPCRERYPDGSYRSAVRPRRGRAKGARALAVRVIPYEWTGQDDVVRPSRLVTTLRDWRAHPARELVALYHRRWEQEGVFREVKGQLSGRPTHLRRESPEAVRQELAGLLLGPYAVRVLILEAARRAGVRPAEVSFAGAVRVLQTRLASAPEGRAARAEWWRRVVAEVGEARVPPRRPRRCPRVRKVTRSHWPVKKPADIERPTPVMRVSTADSP